MSPRTTLLVGILLAGFLPRAAFAASTEKPRVPIPVRTGPAGARTLEDVHIEGEIPVPQVLFITARDQRRFMEFQHHRYLKTSRMLGEATVYPTWIVVTRSGPDGRKETPR